MDMFVESSDPGNFDFTSNIKITNVDFVNNIPVSKDAQFNNVPHSSLTFPLAQPLPAITIQPPNAIGEIRMKVKVSTAGDFKSLTSDQIDNMFILFQLGS